MFVEHKEAVEITEAPAKTLKLSEAIRIGCGMRPVQVKGKWYEGEFGACAMGAAMFGVGFNPNAKNIDQITQFLCRYKDIWKPVTLMNDRGMSREKIADWLESQGY